MRHRRWNERVKKIEIDTDHRSGITTEMAEKLKALKRESRESEQANLDRLSDRITRVKSLRLEIARLGVELKGLRVREIRHKIRR